MFEKYTKNKFSKDTIWIVFCFGAMGGVGILINLLIIKFYDAALLGIFNQVYTVYIILSQFAVGGVHLSVQKYTPQYQDTNQVNDIISSALALTLVVTLFFCCIFYFSHQMIGDLFQSQELTNSFPSIIIGLLFFSLNKVLLAFHNGCRRMKAFASFQLLRFVLMLSALLFIIFFNANRIYVPWILSIAEAILFVAVFAFSFKFFKLDIATGFKEWLLKHFSFGMKSFAGNILLDVNTRIDILALGILASDSLVGKYTLVSTLAEGFLQLPLIFRSSINPLLTECHYHRGKEILLYVIKKNIRVFYKILNTIGAVLVILVPIFFALFFKNDFLLLSSLFLIIMAGIISVSGYLPFFMIFNQIGQPNKQTWFNLQIFFSLVVGNIVLVPLIGIYGSAVTSLITSLVQIGYFKKTLKNLDIIL